MVHRAGRGLIGSLSWSPDGTRLFYLDWSGELNAGRLFSVVLAGGQSVAVNSPCAAEVSVSPNGESLGILTAEDLEGRKLRRLWLSSPPGAPAKPICDDAPGDGHHWHRGGGVPVRHSGTARV